MLKLNLKGMHICAVLIVVAYAALVCLLLGGVEAVGYVVWASSPLAVPLAVSLFARKKQTQWLALTLLLCLAGVGAVLLVWGLVWNPGDYNHLVVLFLPLHQFEFLAVALVVIGLVTLLRRHAR